MSTHILKLTPHVALEDLQKALAELVGELGCPGCGLNGFDIGFETLEGPDWSRFIDKYDFVRDVDSFRVNLADVIDVKGQVGLPG